MRSWGAMARGRVVLWVSVAVVVVGAIGLWVAARDDGDAGRVSTEASLAGATRATLDAETARILLRSDDGQNRVVGLIRLGPEGVARFTYPGNDVVDEFRVFPDAAYANHDGYWMTFTNEELNVHTGFTFPDDASPLLTLVDLLVHALDHAAPETVVETGTAESHGDEVRVFSATVDIGAVLRAVVVVTDEEEAQDYFAIFGRQLTAHLDDVGRARYIRLEGGTELVEIELWDFGVDVEVERPKTASEGVGDDETGARSGAPDSELIVSTSRSAVANSFG